MSHYTLSTPLDTWQKVRDDITAKGLDPDVVLANAKETPAAIGNTPVENLYNLYWFNYYDELYNPDTRIVNMKLYLTPADIANFEFYYKIRIKNREYRVNKIDYKPYELSTVEFILIG